MIEIPPEHSPFDAALAIGIVLFALLAFGAIAWLKPAAPPPLQLDPDTRLPSPEYDPRDG